MSGQPETVTFTVTKVVPIADRDGVPIREGSVTRRQNKTARQLVRGVVVQIVREGQPHDVALGRIGDMAVRLSAGTTQVSNQYAEWEHIPHNEQTVEERFHAWLRVPLLPLDEDSDISRDTQLAASGIMALLPDDLVDWDYGQHPDRLEDALKYLADFMMDTAKAHAKELAEARSEAAKYRNQWADIVTPRPRAGRMRLPWETTNPAE